jgi:glutamate dehydrogenase (NADP+)
MDGLVRRNPGQPEFHQAVEEFVQVVIPFSLANPKYQADAILERMTEPDRIVIFRVT